MKTILVTGSNRSGTTWVGKMLSISGNLIEIWEPFNNLTSNFKTFGCGPLRQQYHHVVESEAFKVKTHILWQIICSVYKSNLKDSRSFTRLFSGIFQMLICIVKIIKSDVGILLKDPIALLSADWVAREYDAQVVVMIRHPASYVSSIKRMKWKMPLSVFLSQPQFMNSLPEVLATEILKNVKKRGISDSYNLEDAALCWKVFHYIIYRYQKNNPHWIFLRHEDLCRNYIEGFRRLYSRLSLRWSDEVEEMIHFYCGNHNPSSLGSNMHVLKRNSSLTPNFWKNNLSHDEVKRIKKITSEIADIYYDRATWE